MNWRGKLDGVFMSLSCFIAKTAVAGSGRAKTDSQNKNQIAGKAQQACRQNTVGSDTDGEESSFTCFLQNK